MTEEIIRDLIDRIPALRELRGYPQIEAEEAIRNAIDDAIEDWQADAEMDPLDKALAGSAET